MELMWPWVSWTAASVCLMLLSCKRSSRRMIARMRFRPLDTLQMADILLWLRMPTLLTCTMLQMATDGLGRARATIVTLFGWTGPRTVRISRV